MEGIPKKPRHYTTKNAQKKPNEGLLETEERRRDGRLLIKEKGPVDLDGGFMSDGVPTIKEEPSMKEEIVL